LPRGSVTIDGAPPHAFSAHETLVIALGDQGWRLLEKLLVDQAISRRTSIRSPIADGSNRVRSCRAVRFIEDSAMYSGAESPAGLQ